MAQQRTVCSYCPTVLNDGDPPTFFGLCIPCGERIDRERRAEAEQDTEDDLARWE